jgi:hypothetical protein
MVRPDEPLSFFDAEVLQEALQVVEDAIAWELSPAHWEAIEPLLDALASALRSGDEAALISATTDLQLYSPVRIITLGSKSSVPPPPPVRYLLNTLVHSIDDKSDDNHDNTKGR